MEKQYIYIFTNPEKPDLIKVGKTNKHPEIRANELSRQTGTIGKFVVEWSLEVSDSEIAEKVAHFKLREFHHSKEYFSISTYDAHLILEKLIIPLFEIVNPVFFYSEGLNRKKRIMKLNESLRLFASDEAQEELEEQAKSLRNKRIIVEKEMGGIIDEGTLKNIKEPIVKDVKEQEKNFEERKRKLLELARKANL